MRQGNFHLEYDRFTESVHIKTSEKDYHYNETFATKDKPEKGMVVCSYAEDGTLIGVEVMLPVREGHHLLGGASVIRETAASGLSQDTD